MEDNIESREKKTPSLPKNVNLENALEIISILGADKIKKVYNLTAWQPVSFAALIKIIKFEEVEKALENKDSLNQIAKKMQVSKKTIYRLFKKKLASRKKIHINCP